jgi:hypothetical protein
MNLNANTTSHALTAIISEQTQVRAIYDTPVLECHGQWMISVGMNVGSVPLPE